MRILICFTLFFIALQTACAERLVDALIARYEQIETVTCDVRRDLSNDDGRMRWLSRVYYARPDRLHVENHAPLPRRIIADGEVMYQHNEGQPRGFRRPIAEIEQNMVDNLRRVPGTVMEHLFRIGDAEEIEFEPEHAAFPLRRGYAADHVFVVLHADEEGRLGRLELFDGADQERLTGEIDFEAFEEVIEGVWIPMVHRGRFQLGGVESRETVRISNYAANTSIPEHLFNADAFFSDVRWVRNFEDL